jgi:hypothetical protein
MNYTRNIIVPVNTFEDSPLQEIVLVKERYLTRIDISMDTVATKGYVGVRIVAGNPITGMFFYPSTPGEWVRKSDFWTGLFDLGEKYTELKILCTSCKDGISATKKHLVIVSITAVDIPT